MSELVSERRIWNEAVFLIRTYGGEATQVALHLASQCDPRPPCGEANVAGYASWLGVARATAELLKPEPDFDERIQ